jgi:hypothetical protein
MYESQLLKIRIRPGKTGAVIDFLRSLKERQELSLDAMSREGMIVESMFLERRDEADYLYYYARARDLALASQLNMQANDPLAQEIRAFIVETWDHIASPEPLFDLDLIREEAAPKPRPRRKPQAALDPKGEVLAKATAAPAPHALAG